MFTHKIEVRFNDYDGMGHVNNAVFLTYLEMARINYIDHFMKSNNLNFRDYGFILAHVSIDYKKPIEAHFVNADIWLSKVGNSSFEFLYRLYNEKDIFATASSIQVSYDYKNRTKMSIPQELRTILEKEIQPN